MVCLNKLRGMGFGGTFLQWLTSYLTDRHQRVTALGATSDAMPVISGVQTKQVDDGFRIWV